MPVHFQVILLLDREADRKAQAQAGATGQDIHRSRGSATSSVDFHKVISPYRAGRHHAEKRRGVNKLGPLLSTGRAYTRRKGR